MKAGAGQSLDPTSIEILTDIMNAASLAPEGVDAVHYRAQHEDWLDVLDRLEKYGYLRKENERYVVKACGLASVENPQTRDILASCEKIFSVLRSHYKSKPRELINIAKLAALVGLTPQKTVECLRYMFDGPILQALSNDFSDPEKAVVQPGEEILKYKSFREVVDQLLEWCRQYESWPAGQLRGWPVDGIASSHLDRVDAAYVREAWEKALERRSTDPEGAVTAARTLLETVCKYILDEDQVTYDNNADLPKLYRLTAQRLNLAPDAQSEKVLKRIPGGCQTVIEGLGSMRNQLSDAHGKGKAAVKPAPRHAELAVNLAGTIVSFLIQTWEARKMP